MVSVKHKIDLLCTYIDERIEQLYFVCWWCGDEDRNCGCWSVANTSWSHPICIHHPTPAQPLTSSFQQYTSSGLHASKQSEKGVS